MIYAKNTKNPIEHSGSNNLNLHATKHASALMGVEKLSCPFRIIIRIKSIFFLVMVAAALFPACSGKDYKKVGQGILISNDSTSVYLQVIRPEIIRVFAFQGKEIPQRESLIVQKDNTKSGSWDVENSPTHITLKTEILKVSVEKSSLRIEFQDLAGNSLLREKDSVARIFTPVSNGKDSAWTIQQLFDSHEGEALYGFGQHQDRLLNVKNAQLNLYQRNRETFVPFLTSSMGYGILWDNYSWTRFGSLVPSSDIPAELLMNEKGELGGLTPHFFRDQAMVNPIKTGLQMSLPCELPDLVKDNVLGCYWTGKLRIKESGLYQLENTGQQNFRLWVDDNLVRDFWSSFIITTDYTRLYLEQDHTYKIRIEWTRSSPNETMTLKWRTPSMAENSISFWSEVGRGIDYYFVYGPSMDKIISGYRTLTGKASLVPKWALGFWQSKERYQTQEEVVTTVKEFRKRNVPLDVIVQDWQYWKPQEWGSHAFDPERYPDPKAMVDSVHALNAKMMIVSWAKFYTGVKNFQELRDAGYIYPYNLKDSTTDWLGNVFAYYDAYNPGAREMYWNQMNRDLYRFGFDSWWLDATEPEVGSNIDPGDMARRMDPNYFGTGKEFLNAYPRFACQAVYEGQKKVNPHSRVVILTRSAFAGQQQFGATSWSGDIVGTWDALKATIVTGLSFSISGIPWWTSDIGGFSVNYPDGCRNPEYRELFTRWYQFGTFCPIFRVHGSNTPREIWNFGDEGDVSYDAQLKFAKTRYRLLPYIYSLAAQVHRNDYTLMRPLIMDFPEDKAGWETDDEYMFGSALLIAPVTLYHATSRPVYLPGNQGWYDFWTGTFVNGGQRLQVPAPLESMPVFVKAGSILPVGPDLQYTEEKKLSQLTLHIYEGQSGEFILYEDDGISNDFEKGNCSTIKLEWNDSAKTLIVGERQGNYTQAPEEITFDIKWISKTRPCGFFNEKPADMRVVYMGEKLVVPAVR